MTAFPPGVHGSCGIAPFTRALLKALSVITSGRRPLVSLASQSARLRRHRTLYAGTAQGAVVITSGKRPLDSLASKSARLLRRRTLYAGAVQGAVGDHVLQETFGQHGLQECKGPYGNAPFTQALIEAL